MRQDFSTSPPTQLHLIKTYPGAERDNFFEQALVLTPERINEYFEAQPRALSALDPKSYNRVSQKLAWRIAKSLSRNVSSSTTEQDAFAQAWFYTIWTELCTILPIRTLARQIAKEVEEKIVLIPLESLDFDCLRYWHKNALEPLLLAAALQRHGVNIFLIHDNLDKHAHEGDNYPRLAIQPSGPWPARCPAIDKIAGPGLFVGEGMRNPDKMRAQAQSSPFVSDVPEDSSPETIPCLWDEQNRVTTIHIPLSLSGELGWLDLWTPLYGMPSLGRTFMEMFVRFTATAWNDARTLVAQTQVRHAHICDHLFFTSALIAHATAEAGGKVNVWPHSSNAIHTSFRKPHSVDCSTTITTSGARTWEKSHAANRLAVKSDLMLFKASTLRPFIPAAPIHIVLWGGAHRFGRMPILDQQQHIAAWRNLLHALTALPFGFNIVLKPKPDWECLEWFEDIIKLDDRISITSEHATKIDLPNMIFISVSLGTSAFLEGLGRGIPCMITRPFEVEDYTALDSDHFPIGDVDLIISTLRRCREDPTFFEKMVEKQVAWFQTETSFT